MKTYICPTCGCSLVRLGIGKDEAVAYQYNGEEYRFCCDGCLDMFISDPKKYLQEISNLVVCPVCLAEKPMQSTVKKEHAGMVLYFCRCPHCVEQFHKNPDYIKRLAGVIEG